MKEFQIASVCDEYDGYLDALFATHQPNRSVDYDESFANTYASIENQTGLAEMADRLLINKPHRLVQKTSVMDTTKR